MAPQRATVERALSLEHRVTGLVVLERAFFGVPHAVDAIGYLMFDLAVEKICDC
jgi:hypothetical protein